jgi:hypothetical protein
MCRWIHAFRRQENAKGKPDGKLDIQDCGIRDQIIELALKPSKRLPVTLPQLALGSASMGSGGALIITILAKVPLWTTLLAFAAYGCSVSALLWSRASPASRRQIVRRLKVGLIAGAFATAAYDGSRYLIVTAGSLNYWPFETFLLFGRSIAGAGLTRDEAYVVGTAYHCLNGLLFAVAYAFLLGRRHWLSGVAFAIVLEITVFSLYPVSAS